MTEQQSETGPSDPKREYRTVREAAAELGKLAAADVAVGDAVRDALHKTMQSIRDVASFSRVHEGFKAAMSGVDPAVIMPSRDLRPDKQIELSKESNAIMRAQLEVNARTYRTSVATLVIAFITLVVSILSFVILLNQ